MKKAAGCLIISSKTNKCLFSLRASNKSHRLTWGLWGGMMEEKEQPKDTIHREMEEEIGFLPNIDRIYPFDVYESNDKKFIYYSFVCVVDEEFIPKINAESDGFAWCNLGIFPKPMHQGTKVSFCHNKGIKKLELILNQHKNR